MAHLPEADSNLDRPTRPMHRTAGAAGDWQPRWASVVSESRIETGGSEGVDETGRAGRSLDGEAGVAAGPEGRGESRAPWRARVEPRCCLPAGPPGLRAPGRRCSVPVSAGWLRRTDLMRVQLDAHSSSTSTGFGRASSRPTRALHRMPEVLRGVAGICAGVERQPRCRPSGVGGTGELQPRWALHPS